MVRKFRKSLKISEIFLPEKGEVIFYVVTLRRGRTRTRPREQLLQNYKA